MHRIDETGHVNNLFSEGNPPSVPATKVGEEWLNAVQEEIANIIETYGVTLLTSGTDTRNQLLAALARKVIAPGGRLTLTSLQPVDDNSGITTIRYTPYLHNIVELYDGTRWVPKVFAEVSQALSDTTKSPAASVADTNYDCFVWNDSGTIRVSRGPAWSSGTSRGTGAGTTELERLDGRYVNKVAITNGPAAQRGLYVGTIRTSATNDLNDFSRVRNVWNYYNRAAKSLSVSDTTDSWTYDTASFRQARAAAANQVEFVVGFREDSVRASVIARAEHSSATLQSIAVGIGVNSTTVASSSARGGAAKINTGPSFPIVATIDIQPPQIGFSFLAWLEKGSGTATTTWYGDDGAGAANDKSGMVGTCYC